MLDFYFTRLFDYKLQYNYFLINFMPGIFILIRNTSWNSRLPYDAKAYVLPVCKFHITLTIFTFPFTRSKHPSITFGAYIFRLKPEDRYSLIQTVPRKSSAASVHFWHGLMRWPVDCNEIICTIWIYMLNFWLSQKVHYYM